MEEEKSWKQLSYSIEVVTQEIAFIYIALFYIAFFDT